MIEMQPSRASARSGGISSAALRSWRFSPAGSAGLAATTELSGAVIAPGSLVVDSNVKKVQHPTGGVVGELRVRDGDQVQAGDIVVRLDETMTQANLAIVAKSLNELQARLARLEAERDNVDSIRFPAELLTRASDPDVARSIDRGAEPVRVPRALQEPARRHSSGSASRSSRRRSRASPAKSAAKTREIELIGQELEGVRELWRKNLVQIQRVTALERDAARLEGERGQLIAATAQAKGKISEIELQILQIDQELRSEVAKDLREVAGQDRRARRAQGRGRGSAEAHRHPRAAERDGASVDRAYGRWRDHRRRGDHADRAGGGRADRRGEARAAGYRPGAGRAERRVALLRFQPAHHARAQRCRQPRLRRSHHRPAHRRRLLHRADHSYARARSDGSRACGSSPECRSRPSSEPASAPCSPTSQSRSRTRSTAPSEGGKLVLELLAGDRGAKNHNPKGSTEPQIQLEVPSRNIAAV